MIVLDTHAWVWWVLDTGELSKAQVQAIADDKNGTIGISAISCWEIAKLTEYGRLELPLGVSEWFRIALAYPKVELLPLTPEIAVESTQLPDDFHRDPADQIIVATSRVYQCALVSSDDKILKYPHVSTVY
ncbi:MAG: type II toxin-antitoxin system VapC family toxin [Caldilineaceae bacterium SB0665_bin_25]|nr:type II toxin-antitoxin system VapC family toxin [Caldilineaceae bacterium SB0665_bin_25]